MSTDAGSSAVAFTPAPHILGPQSRALHRGLATGGQVGQRTPPGWAWDSYRVLGGLVPMRTSWPGAQGLEREPGLPEEVSTDAPAFGMGGITMPPSDPRMLSSLQCRYCAQIRTCGERALLPPTPDPQPPAPRQAGAEPRELPSESPL